MQTSASSQHEHRNLGDEDLLRGAMPGLTLLISAVTPVSDVVVALTAFGICSSRPEIGWASRGSSINSMLKRGVRIFEVESFSCCW